MKRFNDKIKQFVAVTLFTSLVVGCSSSGSDPVPEPVNQVPVAAAGDDQLISRNYNVFLDGGDSSDADDDTLTYTWAQTSGSDVTGGTGSLSGETPTFAAPADVGTLIFELVVNDGVDDSTADTLVIHVLENANVAFFVDGDNGNDDTGNGAMATPYASIARALCEITQEQQDIYVMTRASSAVYDETIDPCPGDPARNTNQILTIPTGTSLYGGYDADWMRDVANNHAAVATLHHGFIFTTVNTNAWFSGFNVVADDSPDPASSAYALSALGGDAGIFIHDNELTAGDVGFGNANSPGSSYGLRVALIETATIERNIISAGFGGDGLDLEIVFQDRNVQGLPGSNASGGTGGAGGGGRYPDYYNGGAGGNRSGGPDGFCISPSGTSGSSGQGSAGGAGGAAGTSCGANGGNGGTVGANGNGTTGDAGAGGNSSGGIDVYEDGGFFASFVSGNGIRGNVGRSGSGGGGGGGGSESLYYNAGSGGGGGGGGAGGSGGTGGDGGGASIGLFIASVSTVLIDDNEITSGVGGNGATGGLGQLGGLGGDPGNGYLTGNAAGNGGNGGTGGIGGTGGRGGAGGGGPSYGILFDGAIEPVISNNIITSNAGGTGGDGSTGGNGGNGGHSYAVYDYDTGDGIVPFLIANERHVGTAGDGGTGGGVAGDSGVSNW